MDMTNAGIESRIRKGWKPNEYLTNLSMAHFADPNSFVASKVFPICPVSLSASYYYIFSKADLARDNVRLKPDFGKVQPAIIGQTDDTYKCKVHQYIAGIDQINTLDYARSRAPGAANPRAVKVRVATEQMLIHMDVWFADKFFKPGVWADEWAGVSTTPAGKQFWKFSDANFGPVKFFDDRRLEMEQTGRRTPNVLALGAKSYNALKNHPDILERVKYSGSTANPAVVNTNVLAQLLGFERIVVMKSTYNAAGIGSEDMQFICSPDSALMCHVTSSPAIDEPSAGYIFAWDMLGNGSHIAFDQFEGEKGTHSEFIEGLMSFDMKKTADDMAMFFKACV
jgi:hypothetical protein